MSDQPKSLPALLDAACKRVNWVATYQHNTRYHPLNARMDAVNRIHPQAPARKTAEDTLRADLEAILTAPEEDVKRMHFQRADSLLCQSPATRFAQAQLQAQALANQAAELARPKITPAELVQQFAIRGISIVERDGNLHVTPASRLSQADKDVLRSYKEGILAVLAAAAEVI